MGEIVIQMVDKYSGANLLSLDSDASGGTEFGRLLFSLCGAPAHAAKKNFRLDQILLFLFFFWLSNRNNFFLCILFRTNTWSSKSAIEWISSPTESAHCAVLMVTFVLVCCSTKRVYTLGPPGTSSSISSHDRWRFLYPNFWRFSSCLLLCIL